MKPDRPSKPRRKRVELRELLRKRGVITENEVAEWLRDGRLYVYRDERGEAVAFYASEDLLRGDPWWVEDRRREPERKRLIEEIRREHSQSSTEEAAEALRKLLDKLGGAGGVD